MFKKIGISIIAFVLLASGSLVLNAEQSKVSAAESTITSVDNLELVTNDMQWKYLDDFSDPNTGTWFESWNKRNGWSYPTTWHDWDGEVYLQFEEDGWKDFQGSLFSTDASTNGQILEKREGELVGSTYFFRHTFRIREDLANEVYAISGTVRYNDAMIMYINGKPVDSWFNIPTSNYKTNLSYGCQDKVVDGYKEEAFLIEDTTSFKNGGIAGEYQYVDGTERENQKVVDEENTVYHVDADGNRYRDITIAVELHTSDENDTDAYFELLSFRLNPATDILPESDAIKSVALNTGASENELNVAWYSRSNEQGYLQIAEGDDPNATFPLERATSIAASSPTLAYTKFTNQHYYSNKAVYTTIEPEKNYVYRVGNDEGFSKVYKLQTKDIQSGYEVLFVSDPQIGTGTVLTDKHAWNDTLTKATSLFPNLSFIINTGDFVDVATKEGEYDGYFSTEILQTLPTATAVGNHDLASNYGSHFNEPNASSYGKTVANSDYYFVYGNVLYMVLNTSSANDLEHVAFMDAVMEETKDETFDWKVVMFHNSIYAAGKQSTNKDVPLRRETLVPAFDRHEIDVVLMGHDHCYARSEFMKEFEVMEEYVGQTQVQDPEGTLYLTTSSSTGSKYYDLVAGGYEYLAFSAQYKVPVFMHLSFTEDTFTMESYRTDSLDVFDSYTIKKTKKIDEEIKQPETPEKPTEDTKTKPENSSTVHAAVDTMDHTQTYVLVLLMLVSGIMLSTYFIKKGSKQ
ncbi:purple acid phosphatase-like protein [Breznakia blatticola]|uniref:Purple acid phosphatase-like protein n=1 Tax=Breznakia blatticola TaxID=1754012 RepID=A0A4V3G9C9_9FIRM|nr:FN3 domain-containing metallophosphoesterase family protein [Breznakia blatticola]TDW26317.1 purple acid phosphatase-like protein [Breznakia blatticola]